MSRISEQFATLGASGRKGLITFITAGDPGIQETPALMHALVAGGADIIELGVPFSDPMADGEVIQRASERALQAGTSTEDILEAVAQFRQTDNRTPVVLMGYLNPLEHIGFGGFARRAGEAGVDALLIVDMPPEEAGAFRDDLANAGLEQIFLVAPNSPDSRIETVCRYASGFLYFVSVKGVTGDKSLAVDEIRTRIDSTRRIAGVPVGIGFGIRSPENAAAAASIADAIIVGSAIVELVEAGGEPEAVRQRVTDFVAQLRAAIDSSADAA